MGCATKFDYIVWLTITNRSGTHNNRHSTYGLHFIGFNLYLVYNLFITTICGMDSIIHQFIQSFIYLTTEICVTFNRKRRKLGINLNAQILFLLSSFSHQYGVNQFFESIIKVNAFKISSNSISN